MKKWICKVCKYAHYGDEAPDYCPLCGADKSEFYLEETKEPQKGWLWVLIAAVGLLTTIFIFFSCRSHLTVDNSTVKNVDLKRYLGRWYEIARFDHSFERKMQKCTADYAMRDDATIKVTNQGMKNGKWKTSVGKAKLTDTPGLLRVSFFGPFYSDYRIMMLAPDYSYALVGSDSDDYLWILARTPQLSKDVKDRIVKEADRRGYKTADLIWVEQDVK